MKLNKLFFLTGFLYLISCGSSEEHSENETNDLDSTQVVEDEIVEEQNLDYDINLTQLEKQKIPFGCDYEGKVVDIYSWKDANGENIFIRSTGNYVHEEVDRDYYPDIASQYLYAYHYVEDGKDWKLLRDVTDFIKDCEFDVIVSHVPTAVELKDIDKDNIGEIAFVYRLACTSDVSGSEQKLLMLEDGEKYILRGYTEVMGEGGEFEVGDEFQNAPEGFLEQAKKMWEENRTEYDFEL